MSLSVVILYFPICSVDANAVCHPWHDSVWDWVSFTTIYPREKEPKLFSEDERIKKLKGHILNNIRIKGEIINLIKHNSKKREKRKKGNKKKWAKKSNAVENELTLVHKLRAPVIPRCVSVFQTNWVRSATENADLSVYSQSAAVLLPGLQLAVASLTPERPCE